MIADMGKTGGKREGAGRPKTEDPATKLVTFKATPGQHAKWLELGGSRWVKRLLNEQLTPTPKQPVK